MVILTGTGTGRDWANFDRDRDRPGSDFDRDRDRDRPGLRSIYYIAVICTVYMYRVIKKLCTFLKHRHFLQEVRRDLKFLHDLDKCWEGLQKNSAF